MWSKAERVSIPVWVGLGAVTWGLLLLAVWAIHPVEGVATFAPVDNPSAEQQASIDQVLADFDDGPVKLIERFQCDATPLDAATAGAATSSAPELEPGFEYTSPPCSGEYDAARAAFWVNVLAVLGVIALAAAWGVRQSLKSPETPDTSDHVMAASDGDSRAVPY